MPTFSFPSAPAWVAGALLLLASMARSQDSICEYGMPPAAPEAVGAARAAVIREDTPGDSGRVRHRFTFPDGSIVEFEDRPKGARDTARRERVVSHVGRHSAAAEPEATFTAAGQSAGLSSDAVAALRYVSRHEGGFDAINTWDSARFSWGFIQFAGGYGLRPMLAYLKSKSADAFHNLLAVYGIDVLPDAAGKPEPVCVDPAGELRRGAEAEQAFGDDPLLIAVFIRAGGISEVKQRQVEVAIRDYAAPALAAQQSGQLLSRVLCSPQGLAMLIDRQVHDGNVGRLRWSLEHARIQQAVEDPQRWPELEGRVMDLAVRDADARGEVVSQVERAVAALQRALSGLEGEEQDQDHAQAADLGACLAETRTAMEAAAWQCDYRMVVGPRRDSVRLALTNALAVVDDSHLAGLAASEVRGVLAMTQTGLRAAVAAFRYDRLVRNRLAGIRTSELVGPPPTPDLEPGVESRIALEPER